MKTVKTVFRFITTFAALISIVDFPMTAMAASNTNSANFVRASVQFAANTTTNLGITSGNFTIECWIKPASLNAGANQYGIAGQGDAGGSNNGIGHYLAVKESHGGVEILYSKPGIANTTAIWATEPAVGTWLHLAYVYDGVNITLYSAPIGGIHTQRAQTAASGTGNVNANSNVSVGTADVDSGTTFSGTRSFDGLVDDCRFWNTARTTAQLDANFQKELVGNEAGLVAYYTLDNVWTDLTSGAHTLTTSGSPTFSTDVPFTGATTFQFRQLQLF
jgi:hypothetical protein